MLPKTRHNKKRNTAFLYEALVRELTKCIVAKDEKRKGIVVSLVREQFAPDSTLRKELNLYKALYESGESEVRVCEKLINEVKRSHSDLDKQALFNEQTALINKINRLLSKAVFNNFVPNYKDLATISQILNPDVSIKHRVLLETTLAEQLSTKAQDDDTPMVPIDNLVYKTFVKKFNDQYNGKLLESQQQLLGKYIASFHDDGTDLGVFLNEEVGRLKGIVNASLDSEEISSDKTLLESAQKVLKVLNDCAQTEISPKMIEQVLKIQNLVEELNDQ